jgi:hypothetical protein
MANPTRPSIPADFKPVRVGDGHGFIIEGKYSRRYVITAAHCLPELPPAHPASYLHERTYRALLAPFGAAACSVWAECLFVDPVSDIAVLGSPDDQELSDEAELYEALLETGVAVEVSDPSTQYRAQEPLTLGGKTYIGPPLPVLTDCGAWLFSLDTPDPELLQHPARQVAGKPRTSAFPVSFVGIDAPAGDGGIAAKSAAVRLTGGDQRALSREIRGGGRNSGRGSKVVVNWRFGRPKSR